MAGVCFGLAFRFIGEQGRSGSFATAAAMGLVVGDAARRFGSSADATLLVLTVLAVGLLMWLGARSARQAGVIVALAVPFAAVGLGVALLPDLLEDVLRFG